MIISRKYKLLLRENYIIEATNTQDIDVVKFVQKYAKMIVNMMKRTI